MKWARASTGVLMALAVLVAAGATHAQSAGGRPAAQGRAPIRAELSEEARRSWDSAIELFEAQDFRGARVEFMRAWELSRNPRVLFNVGVCEKSLLRYARAAAVWRQQLEVGVGKLSEEEIRATQGAIAAVEPFISSLAVRINVEGATLFIDEEEVGNTPFLELLPVDVGRHAVRVRKAGYQDHLGEVEIASGAPGVLDVKLEPLVRTALVDVVVDSPAGATIFVNGVDMGPAPFKGELPVGRHTIEARAPGYVTARQTSEVVWEQPVRVAFSLSRERRDGKVRVRVSEADAIISVNGKVVGSGSWEGVLPTGGHQLVVRKDGFRTYSSEIALSDDQVRTVTVPLLREERGAAWVWWTVGSVAVLAGGAVATYFVAKPSEQVPVTGTWGSITTQ